MPSEGPVLWIWYHSLVMLWNTGHNMQLRTLPTFHSYWYMSKWFNLRRTWNIGFTCLWPFKYMYDNIGWTWGDSAQNKHCCCHRYSQRMICGRRGNVVQPTRCSCSYDWWDGSLIKIACVASSSTSIKQLYLISFTTLSRLYWSGRLSTTQKRYAVFALY